MMSIECPNCGYLFRENETFSCLAFPEGIPEEIATGEVSHKRPYDGDGGIQFLEDEPYMFDLEKEL